MSRIICGNCGCATVNCEVCYQLYDHGTVSCCTEPDCIEMNVPVSCSLCGFDVCADLTGVIDYEHNLIPYVEVR